MRRERTFLIGFLVYAISRGLECPLEAFLWGFFFLEGCSVNFIALELF